MRLRASVATMSLAVLLLGGCTFFPRGPLTPVDPSPSPSALPPSASPDPSPSPSDQAEPSPSPSTAPPVSTVTCDSLLDEDTKATFAEYSADGWAEAPDFAQRAIDEGNLVGEFVELGGVACQWGFPDSDSVYNYGYSAISAADATAIKERLVAEGALLTQEFGGDLYCYPDVSGLGYEDCYLFLGTEWFHSLFRSEFEMLVSQAHLG